MVVITKVCGEFQNTDIKDTEVKGQGKEGFIKTREVRDGINIIERQKNAVNDIIGYFLSGRMIKKI